MSRNKSLAPPPAHPRARRALRVVGAAAAARAGVPGVPDAAAVAARDPSTDAYYQRIVEYAHHIRSATELSDIVRLLGRALDETHALHQVAALAAAHRQVEAAEARIADLKREVETVNGLLYIDHLTGALNRRGLEDAYQREVARADRTGKSLTLALIDLDNFKKINDQVGHVVGDHALVHVSAILRATLRPQDLVARYGGEEFAVLLSETTLDAGAAAVQRARAALSANPLTLAGCTLSVTFSAGIAACHGDEALDTLLARADHALYSAKRAGKDQACIAA